MNRLEKCLSQFELDIDTDWIITVGHEHAYSEFTTYLGILVLLRIEGRFEYWSLYVSPLVVADTDVFSMPHLIY